MIRTAVLAAAALAIVLCGGCRQQAGDSEPQQGTSQFDKVEATLASIEADVNQP